MVKNIILNIENICPRHCLQTNCFIIKATIYLGDGRNQRNFQMELAKNEHSPCIR